MSLSYLDTSAIVKLFKAEPETAALKKYLDAGLITSSISRIEVKRVIDRNPAIYSKAALAVLDNFQFITADSSIFAIAESLSGLPFLRSLDAIHLASAIYAKPIIAEFITYDDQLAAAAMSLGFNVTAPGVTQ